MTFFSFIHRVIIVMIVMTSFYLIHGCSGNNTQEYVFNDFEKDSDLDRLNWNCQTLYSLSSENTSHGASALKMDLYPSPYPGVSFNDFKKNWTGFRHLRTEMTNPYEKENLTIVLRIDDIEDAPDYQNRCNLRLVLLPRQNRIDIPFERLVTPSGRPLDLAHITSLMFFMVNPDIKKTVYMDDIRLTK